MGLVDYEKCITFFFVCFFALAKSTFWSRVSINTHYSVWLYYFLSGKLFQNFQWNFIFMRESEKICLFVELTLKHWDFLLCMKFSVAMICVVQFESSCFTNFFRDSFLSNKNKERKWLQILKKEQPIEYISIKRIHESVRIKWFLMKNYYFIQNM